MDGADNAYPARRPDGGPSSVPSVPRTTLYSQALLWIVFALIAASTVLTAAGRDRLKGWAQIAASGVSEPPAPAVIVAVPSELNVEQGRAARYIARRYRVALEPTEHIVFYAFESGLRYQIDPYLVLAVIAIESRFNPVAESGAGARGLMQIMPHMHLEKFEPFGGVESILTPSVNIHVGTSIIREYWNRFKSLDAALRAYVGVGPQGITRYPERVLHERDRLIAASQGRALISPESEAKGQPIGKPLTTEP